MKIEHNRIFYVYFCFIILFTSSCKAQYKEDINIFFQKLSKESYDYCLDNDDYKHFKEKKNIKAISLLESACNESIKDYKLYTKNTFNLIDSLIQNRNDDFIIVNKPLKSISYSNPTLTILKFRNEKKYDVVHNDYAYNEQKKEYYLITDTQLVGFNTENNFKEFESYFYSKQPSNKIFDTFEEAKKKANSFNVYYIVARVSGKMILEKIFFADEND